MPEHPNHRRKNRLAGLERAGAESLAGCRIVPVAITITYRVERESDAQPAVPPRAAGSSPRRKPARPE
jgi:hypothetical protein